MNTSRIEKIIGDNIYKLKKAKVLLVGLGGVGGICFEMLVRSGIENIAVVDYDKFEESNLNRQILSFTNNINENKVFVAKDIANKINSSCKVTIYNKKLDIDFLNNLKPDFNYIIDACDDINAKVCLVKYSIKNNIKIISSCGTGNRVDPTKLYYTDIWKTENDPLARKFRNILRKEGISYKVPVVTSSEIPLLKTKDFVGSMAMVPNTCGIFLANFVINDIINKK